MTMPLHGLSSNTRSAHGPAIMETLRQVGCALCASCSWYGITMEQVWYTRIKYSSKYASCVGHFPPSNMRIDVWHVYPSAVDTLHLLRRACLCESMLVPVRVCCHVHAARTCQAWMPAKSSGPRVCLTLTLMPVNNSSLFSTSVAAAPEDWTISWQADTEIFICYRCDADSEACCTTGGGGHGDSALRRHFLRRIPAG